MSLGSRLRAAADAFTNGAFSEARASAKAKHGSDRGGIAIADSGHALLSPSMRRAVHTIKGVARRNASPNMLEALGHLKGIKDALRTEMHRVAGKAPLPSQFDATSRVASWLASHENQQPDGNPVADRDRSEPDVGTDVWPSDAISRIEAPRPTDTPTFPPASADRGRHA